MAFAWVLNLDAELELGRPGYVQSIKVAEQLARYAASAHALFGPGDVEVRPGDILPCARVGRAWCPTPAALAALRAAGAEPEPSPPASVLRAANHRRFSFALGGGPEGSVYVEDRAELERAISTRRDWLLKRPLGFAGRGQLYVRGTLQPNQQSWIDASLRDDGLLVEPLLQPNREFGLHGFIRRDGRFGIGRPCVQEIGPRGVWKRTRLAAPAELEPEERAELVSRAEAVAEALVRLGYFGPFGIDAYRYSDGAARGFCALSEINARYTMGFATGYPIPAHELSV